MKIRTLVLLLSVAVVFVPPSNASIIAGWNFERTPTPIIASGTSGTYGVADTGLLTAGSLASGTHASSSTWSFPIGNGSSQSFSVNNWAVSDYWQFRLSTVGYADLKLSWEQASSNTGPRDYGLFYSTDGTSFTLFASYSVLANASPNPVWTSGTPQPAYKRTADLSALSALDNKLSIYFRLQDLSTVSANGGTVGIPGGTDRVDNFMVDAIPVPEPSTFVAGALLALPFGVQGVRYLRNRKRA